MKLFLCGQKYSMPHWYKPTVKVQHPSEGACDGGETCKKDKENVGKRFSQSTSSSKSFYRIILNVINRVN